MKKTLLKAISPAVALFILASCGSSSSKEKVQDDLKKDIQQELRKDNAKEEIENTTSEGPKEAMSVAEATKFLSAADGNKGKLITINAYPKGMTKSINGEFQLYVSDKTGSGLTNENFACNFKEEMKDVVKTHKSDNLIKVSGNIAWNNGMIVLKNAKLVD